MQPFPASHFTQRTESAARALPEHDARLLTGAVGQAHIRLDDQIYTLRITRAGKLILTK